MSRDPACIFCKIVDGLIPSARVLETDRAVAFLDVNPVNKGHVLVVPRDHHATLPDMPDELAGQVAALVPRLARALMTATGADGLNLIVNVGEAAGQTIGHVHWHLIPRFHDDPVNWPWPHAEYAGDELGQMQARIAHALGPRDD